MPKLYLIPCFIAPDSDNQALPAINRSITSSLHYFIVENARSARRFLSKTGVKNIEERHFLELNKNTGNLAEQYFKEAGNHDIGLLSEAGCPGVADPGAAVVHLAHQKGYEVLPLVGPSSILLALMGSGMNGQRFEFHGYLPIHQQERTQAIRRLETVSEKNNSTQLFIETPYRNNQLVSTLLKTCQPETSLCIACQLTAPDQYIKTRTIREWQTQKPPDLHKKTTIFLIFSGTLPVL